MCNSDDSHRSSKLDSVDGYNYDFESLRTRDNNINNNGGDDDDSNYGYVADIFSGMSHYTVLH